MTESAEQRAEPVATDLPFLVLTVVLDSGARAATATMSHADALEEARKSVASESIAGLSLVELPIGPAPFGALRKHLGVAPTVIGLYDLFPLASHLDSEVRRVAGQFLAAEALWALEEQGMLGGVPLNVKFEVPPGWSSEPKKLHDLLLEAGALELTAAGIETFKRVKTDFDQRRHALEATSQGASSSDKLPAEGETHSSNASESNDTSASNDTSGSES
ncbi:MAG: hypothetical protein AAF355_02350 [Myxococcota bacterium]